MRWNVGAPAAGTTSVVTARGSEPGVLHTHAVYAVDKVSHVERDGWRSDGRRKVWVGEYR